MNKTKLFSAVFFALPFLTLSTGCATLTRGTTEAYQVVSDPSGALVTLSTGETCTTPCVIDKKRDESFLVTIEKAGYEPYSIQVNSESCDQGRLAMAGNLLLIGSLIWASVDSLSGATQSLTPNPCEAKLVPAIFPAAVAQPLPIPNRGDQG
ncbi:MAG TPA: PEGA domain-containing protein [Desulfurivibrionaceae bacterium]|nr:PEGA domain-containing protein [Desulfurivibrionaceae bacterium]